MPDGVKGATRFSISLPPDLAEVARARRFLTEIAAGAGFPDSRIFDITVAASEAAANAIEHAPAKGQVEVTAILSPDRLEVQIEGPGEFQTPDRLKERQSRGLGLPLMAKFSDHLALYSGPQGGTLVSLTFYRPGAAERSEEEEALPPSIRELIEENQLTSAIAENAPIGIYVLDSDLSYRWYNAAYQAFLEEPYRSRDLAGLYVGDVVPGAEEAGIIADFKHVSNTGQPILREESELVGYRRGPTWWRRSVSPLREITTAPPYDLLVVVSEETGRKRAEEERERMLRAERELSEQLAAAGEELDSQFEELAAQEEELRCQTEELAESELRFRTIADFAHDWVLWVEATGEVVYCSPSVKRITGYHPQDFYDRPELLVDIVHPDDHPHARSHFTNPKPGADHQSEYRIIIRSGEVRWIQHACQAIFDDKGIWRGRRSANRDVTERKQAERALRDNEQLHRSIAASFPNGAIFVFDKDLRFLVVEGQALARLGLTSEALEGRALHDLDEETRTLIEPRYRRVLAGERFEVETEYRGRTMLSQYVPLFDEAGRITRGMVVALDITERKRIEEALRQSESFDRQALESIPGMVFTTRPDGYCDYQSQQWVVYTGVPMSEHLGDGWNELLHPDDRPRAFAAWRAAVEGRAPYNLEYRVRRYDGVYEWFKVIGQPIFDAKGEIVKWFGVAVNIEELKRAEEAQRQSEERYRALAEENERLYRQQLEIAEHLQGAFLHLPSELGSLRLGHLYRSATEAARIGGDFYDVFQVADGRVAVLIGDVAGHGIEAARVAALTKDVIHAFGHKTQEPEEILKDTNSLLLEKQIQGFVTTFLGLLDPKTGSFRYACAGHPRMLLKRESGEVALLEDGAPPLGVFAQAQPRVGETELTSGDLLLLYTDGVTEARQDGEFFGEERLEAMLRQNPLSVEELPAQILDRVLSFSGGILKDDVAILSLLVTEDGAAS